MIKPHDGSSGQIVAAVSPIKPEEVEKRYRDWPFAVLFMVNVGVIFILVASLGATAAKSNSESLSDSNIKALVGVASGMAVVAMALAVLMAKIIPLYAHGMILFVLWFNLGVAVAFVAIGIAIANFLLAALGVVVALLNWCYVRSVKHRIPLAVAHLRVAEAAISKNAAIYVVSLVFTIVQIFWVVMWSLALLGVTAHLSKKSSSATTLDSTQTQSGGNYSWAYALLMLSFYWGIQVVKNVVHTTVAGTVAAFWYQSEPSNATRASLKRATTTSFGSICFGSLLVAILQTLHALAKNSRKKGGAAACVAECLLSWLESIMEYLNRWAFVYVGIYGYSFTKAGGAVSQLFHHRGFTALLNDDLVRIVLRLTAIGVGLICACVGAVVAELSDAFTFQFSTTLLAILGFVVGFSVALTPLAVVSSSVATIFVCFAEDPVPFQRSHPELYAALAQGWHGLHPDLIVQAGYWHV
ncbi:Metal transporter cnnm2 [Phytophthora pseudosyringae]|uniref:Choline transporter-like protein n=1 Tax=Phytophthora pseudosyringae TaxID=221518 RepID=A0A8T1VTN1_9STRA|nr:Metal transporter cnnm2 [Phytophthora pseudosyringae]